jgi:hypothetical protein
MAGTDTIERGRGWGPFTGRQLTTIIVTVIVMVMLPTAALAASGAFTSSTVAPALTATNSSAAAGSPGVVGSNTGGGVNARFGVKGTANGTAGIGVQGFGARFGVQSVGPFQATGAATFNGSVTIADGKPLSCSGCVGPLALSAATSQLASGQSESGVYSVGAGSSTDGYMSVGMTFARPVPGVLTAVFVHTSTAPVPHCAGPGSADPGFMCIYENNGGGGLTLLGGNAQGSPVIGYSWFWRVTGTGEFDGGIYTVRAP